MGAEAALAVLDASADSAPCVICLDGNKITKRSLMECVDEVTISFMNIKSNSSLTLYERKTKIWFILWELALSFWTSLLLQTLTVKEATKAKDFEEVVRLRGRYVLNDYTQCERIFPTFNTAYNTPRHLHTMNDQLASSSKFCSLRFFFFLRPLKCSLVPK